MTTASKSWLVYKKTQIYQRKYHKNLYKEMPNQLKKSTQIFKNLKKTKTTKWLLIPSLFLVFKTAYCWEVK
jgi:hypothetical protein